MPAEQPFLGERRRKVLGRVEHHFDDAFDVAIRGGEGPDIHAEAAGDGGSHLILVEQLAFDFAGFQDIFGKGLEDGFSAEVEAERVHPAKQKALAMTDGWEAIGKRVSAPFQTRPAFDLMDVLRHSPHSLRGIWALCAAGARLFSA